MTTTVGTTKITFEDITDGDIEGTGFFDTMMRSINGHLAAQMKKNRINKTDYAEVYVGSLQYAITESIKFNLQRYAIETAADLSIANALKIEMDKELAAANVLLVNCKTAQCYKETLQIEANTLGVLENNKLTTKKIADLVTNTLRTVKETELTGSRIAMTNNQAVHEVTQELLTSERITKTVSERLNVESTTTNIDGRTEHEVVQKALTTAKVAHEAEQENLTEARIRNMDKTTLKIDKDILRTVADIDHTEKKILQTECETARCQKLVLHQAQQTLTEVEQTKRIKWSAASEKAKTDAADVDADSVIGLELVNMEWKNAITKSETDGSDLEQDSFLRGKLDKMRADAINAQAEYSKIGTAFSYTASTTAGGMGTLVIPKDSYLGAKAHLSIATAAEKQAQYDPAGAGVVSGSLLDCKKKLTCSQAVIEEAQYTDIGDTLSNGIVLGHDSFLGAKTAMIKYQSITEKANVEGGVIDDDSLIGERIREMHAKADAATAEYNIIGTGAVAPDENSYLWSRAKLLRLQAATEKANTDPTDLEEGSLMSERINKMQADAESAKAQYTAVGSGTDKVNPSSYLGAKANLAISQAKSALAEYNPTLAGVVAGSLLDCKKTLACAQATAEEAQYTKVGATLTNGKTLDAESYLGAKTNLLKFQAATEKANVDGEDIKDDSLIQAKYNKMNADAMVALAPFAKTGVNYSYTAGANGALGTMVIPEASSLGAKTGLLIAQESTELANTSASASTQAKKGSFIYAKIKHLESQQEVEDSKKRMYACQSNLYCAQALETTANFTTGDVTVPDPDNPGETMTISAEIDENTPMGQKALLVQAQTNEINARWDGKVTINTESPLGCIAKKDCAQAAVYASQSTSNLAQAAYNTAKTQETLARFTTQDITQTDAEGVTTTISVPNVPPASQAGQSIALISAQVTTEAGRASLFSAQASVENARVTAEIAEKQGNLYTAQAEGFAATARYNKAKILGDMYAISRTAGDTGVGTAKAETAKSAANAIPGTAVPEEPEEEVIP